MSTSSPIEYTDYDFDTLVTALQNQLYLESAWKDLYRSATGEMLIELFAAVGTEVLYYIERRAQESYILTAQNLSSVINLVRLLDYTPRRNVSASGTLRFSLAAPATVDVYINQWTTCQTASGKNYLVSNPGGGVIGEGDTFVDLEYCIQGIMVPVTYTSSGVANQEYNIEDTAIENSSQYKFYTVADTELEAQQIRDDTPGSRYEINNNGTYNIYRLDDPDRPVTISVIVDGVVWYEVNTFINSTTISQHYIIKPELDGTITIVFGDGVFGKSPALGNTIVLNYVRSLGLSGNVYNTGLVNRVITPIYDKNGVLQTVSVTNPATPEPALFLGGANAETMDEIKENAPNVFATGDRLVTKQDFKSLIKAYPQVGDVNVWGENEESSPDYDHYNQVKISIILQEWYLPDATFESRLSNYLYTKSLMTVRYSYVDPDVLEVVPTLRVVLVTGASISTVESLINTALENLFLLGSTTTLGVSKYHSDIVGAIENINGVDHVYVNLTIKKELTGVFYIFTVTAANASVGDTYTNNGETFTVRNTCNEETTLYCSGTGAPAASGNLIWTSGSTGSTSTIAFSTSSNYEWGAIMDVLPALVAGVEIYIDDTNIAVDDGAGGWVDVGSGYTVTGDVDYTSTGLVGVNISPAPLPAETVYVQYRTDQSGDIIVTQNQILKYVSNSVVYTSIG